MMQLDKTEIVIRQRSTPELLDLSLRVIRNHGHRLVAAMAIVGIPLLVLDVLAIEWMLREDSLLALESLEDPSNYAKLRHGAHLIALYVTQFPLISLPATLLLGSIAFFDSLTLRQLLAKLCAVLWPASWVLGILRLGLVVLVLELFVNRKGLFDPVGELAIVLGLLLVCFVRASWPFAAEIIGLEQCPLYSKPSAALVNYGVRRRGLHDSSGADHILRFIVCSSVVGMLTIVALAAIGMADSVITGQWSWDSLWSRLILPTTMWMVSTFVVVFRFLSYLDSRIRMEGWEIELRLRAEGQRVQESMSESATKMVKEKPKVTA
jgi:hypothetical protein